MHQQQDAAGDQMSGCVEADAIENRPPIVAGIPGACRAVCRRCRPGHVRRVGQDHVEAFACDGPEQVAATGADRHLVQAAVDRGVDHRAA